MRRLRVLSTAAAASAGLFLSACTPRPEDTPPSPKVSATTEAKTPAAAKVAQALPVLGPAPTWQLKDLNGKVVGSEQLKGKVVVVDFWATWCGPCRVEIPGYVEMQRKYEAEGLVIVGISLDEAGPGVVKAFADKFAINYPIVMGDDAVMSAFGGVEALPTTFLIDRDGKIRDRKLGAEHSETYEKKVLAVLRAS